MDLWSYTAGERPHTVKVYEREPGGVLYVSVWSPTARDGKGNVLRRSLGHRDKKAARAYARGEAAKLERGIAALRTGQVTLAQVFTAYRQHPSPRKSVTDQRADERRVKMWSRVLGGASDPHCVAKPQCESFIDARRSGAIDALGDPVAENERKPVRARTVGADCEWLSLVFHWAAKWPLASGGYLMRENPVRGFGIPHEENPRRPVATADRFDAVRAVSDCVEMELRRKGQKRVRQRSYLSELLDIAHSTGRRLNAICKLRFQDVRFERTASEPHGAIVWPAATDKRKKERRAPLSPRARAAIARIVQERPSIGDVPLFPSPSDAARPMSRHLADAWLRSAEAMAKVPKQTGGLWHPYRRGWATARKHLPDADVMAAGGWESLDALKASYQHADPTTMLRVVMEPTELREAR